ncbi:PEP-CTERM sorting domain-containing protein [uncultured Rhodoblastus sp.]|uniref:PEP-CTERM sorting domain-containing protein n=1 Tax=uncultured Rhodoblastus sp. TaxID=543037 RepID=UPI0025E55DEA|nr:PEP-CTERM sorting domain-containing protein [uncultured Rhodoblastus sp.]
MDTSSFRAFMIGALLLVSSPCFAATVSFTGSVTGNALIYDPATDYSPATGYSPPGNLGGYDALITLSGFNAALGALNSVTLTTLVSGSLEFKQAYNIYGAPTNILNAVLYISGGTPYGGMGAGLPFTFSSSGNPSFFDTGVQTSSSGPSSYTNNLSTTFGPFFVNTIYVPVLAYVYLLPGNTSYIGNATSTFFYRETVTYDYTPSAPSAPEPATWATMLLGFAGVAFMAYRRKSKPALLAA